MEIKDVITRIKETFGIFGNELVMRKSVSYKDLDSCGGEATKDETTNTCVEDVAVNHTVYRNSNRCNYIHPNCKCCYVFFLTVNSKSTFPKKKLTGIFSLMSPSQK